MVLSVVNEKDRLNEQSKAQKRKPTKEYVRIYKLFMQNKPNYMRLSPENADFTKKQTQFKPNLTQNKPNSKPIKPKTKPIQTQFVERPKMNPFAWIRSLTIVLIILLADFTTLKGANFKQHTGRKKFIKPDNI